jgi:hypothetical protein
VIRIAQVAASLQKIAHHVLSHSTLNAPRVAAKLVVLLRLSGQRQQRTVKLAYQPAQTAQIMDHA